MLVMFVLVTCHFLRLKIKNSEVFSLFLPRVSSGAWHKWRFVKTFPFSRMSYVTYEMSTWDESFGPIVVHVCPN